MLEHVGGAALLRELEAHPACAADLLTYEPVSRVELDAMSAEEKERRSRRTRDAVQTTAGWQRARDLLRDLGRLRYAPAVPLIGRVWRHSWILPLRWAAGHALFRPHDACVVAFPMTSAISIASESSFCTSARPAAKNARSRNARTGAEPSHSRICVC